MADKIKCSDCAYYHIVPSWAKDEMGWMAWCRIQETKIPADKQKTRCKYYKQDKQEL